MIEVALRRSRVGDGDDPPVIVDLTHPRHPQPPLLDQHAADLLEEGKALPDPDDRLVCLGQRGVDPSNPLRSPLGADTARQIAIAHRQAIPVRSGRRTQHAPGRTASVVQFDAASRHRGNARTNDPSAHPPMHDWALGKVLNRLPANCANTARGPACCGNPRTSDRHPHRRCDSASTHAGHARRGPRSLQHSRRPAGCCSFATRSPRSTISPNGVPQNASTWASSPQNAHADA